MYSTVSVRGLSCIRVGPRLKVDQQLNTSPDLHLQLWLQHHSFREHSSDHFWILKKDSFSIPPIIPIKLIIDRHSTACYFGHLRTNYIQGIITNFSALVKIMTYVRLIICIIQIRLISTGLYCNYHSILQSQILIPTLKHQAMFNEFISCNKNFFRTDCEYDHFNSYTK